MLKESSNFQKQYQIYQKKYKEDLDRKTELEELEAKCRKAENIFEALEKKRTDYHKITDSKLKENKQE